MTQYEQHSVSLEEFRAALIDFIGQTLEFGSAFQENEKYVTTESPVRVPYREVMRDRAEFINYSLDHIGGLAVNLSLNHGDSEGRPYTLKEWCGVGEGNTLWKLGESGDGLPITIPSPLLIEGLRTLRT